MFNDIENTLLYNDLQACLIGDLNAHTSNVSEYVVIDNNILDVLNLQDDDKLPLNSLHILEECNIPAIRCSQDKHTIDKYGNRLLDLCRSLELFFVNGRVGTDRGIDQPTCNNSNSVIDYALISPTLFRSVIDFNVLTFDPILSDIHKHICLHLCTNIVNNSNLTEDTDIDNELNSSDIVITHVGESKDYHIVITREGESVVKPRWCGDRIPVFKDSLDLSVYLFRRKTLYCAFTDYRKAFDSVYSILLWQKLLRTSIDGNKLIAIQNMYKNAVLC
jgi:hypothetical protein